MVSIVYGLPCSNDLQPEPDRVLQLEGTTTATILRKCCTHHHTTLPTHRISQLSFFFSSIACTLQKQRCIAVYVRVVRVLGVTTVMTRDRVVTRAFRRDAS
jgi:hypothetical protein